MGIEDLLIESTLKAAAGNFGKKIADVVLSYPLMDRMKSLVPFTDRATIEDFSRGKITDADIQLIRKHLTEETNQTKEFKALVQDAFNLSAGDTQLLMKHFKALNDMIGQQNLVDQHNEQGLAAEAQQDNLADEAREKIVYHEEQALKLLELRH